MQTKQFLTTIYVPDHASAIDWYTRFFGRGFDTQPQPDCREWEVVPGAFLQVIQSDEKPSGHGAFVLHDLADTEKRLQHSGIAVTRKKIGPYQVSQCTDPAGNVITLLAPQ